VEVIKALVKKEPNDEIKDLLKDTLLLVSGSQLTNSLNSIALKMEPLDLAAARTQVFHSMYSMYMNADKSHKVESADLVPKEDTLAKTDEFKATIYTTFLHDKHTGFRLWAARELRGLGYNGKNTTAVLTVALRTERNPVIKYEIGLTLAKIDPTAAIVAGVPGAGENLPKPWMEIASFRDYCIVLLIALQESDSVTRTSAAQMLRDTAPFCKEAFPAVLQIFHSENDPKVKDILSESLRKMDLNLAEAAGIK
jgi:hypothetical protein